MSGLPGLEPVESNDATGAVSSVNLTEVGGTAVKSSAATLGLVGTEEFSSTGVAMDAKPVQPAVTSADLPVVVDINNSTADNTVRAAGGAATYVVVTGLTLSWQALTAGGLFQIYNGASAGAALLWECLLPTAAASAAPFSVTFPTPLACSANTALTCKTATASTVGHVYASFQTTLVA